MMMTTTTTTMMMTMMMKMMTHYTERIAVYLVDLEALLRVLIVNAKQAQNLRRSQRELRSSASSWLGPETATNNEDNGDALAAK